MSSGISPFNAESPQHLGEQDRPEITPAPGYHLIFDAWGCENLSDATLINRTLVDAAEAAGATILNVFIHSFGGGGGVTGVAALAESHISVHTWPENDYAAFDIFMCGDCQPEKSLAILRAVFKPTSTETRTIVRGKPAESQQACERRLAG